MRRTAALAELFCNYKHYFARGMMTVYLLAVVSLKGTTYTTAVLTIHGIKFLKVRYCLLMLDARDKCCFF